ncbi:hypothetical protein ACFVFS_39905 [Kitasatospora sp. NPDC057692]|uniref:hypothetical protein n=1 Tax=Kitasatospora sp. NPDC057692 TaxID=3346215 RepID=UPI00369447F1
MIRTVLNGLPMFWPGLLASLVPAALLNRPVGRLLRTHWAVGFVLLLALGGVATLTLLPEHPRPFWQDPSWAGVVHHCALDGLRLRPPGEWFTSRQADLAVLMFAPIGLAAALTGSRRRAGAVLLGGAFLPFALEAAQYAVPALGRACDGQDALDSVLGLALGALLGLLARPALRHA